MCARPFLQGKLEMAGGRNPMSAVDTALFQHAYSVLYQKPLLRDSVDVSCTALPELAVSVAACFAAGMHTSNSSQPGHAMKALGSLLQQFVCQARLISLTWVMTCCSRLPRALSCARPGWLLSEVFMPTAKHPAKRCLLW